MNERTVVFVDAPYLIAACTERNAKYDIFRLLDLVSKDRNLLRCYYYDGVFSQDDAKRNPDYQEKREKKLNFIRMFTGRGITTRLINLKFRGDEPIQKGVDVRIATDMLILAMRDAYDIGVLVSGDGDFAEVIREIKYLGKKVEVASFHRGLADSLEAEADRMWYLDDHWDEIGMQVAPKEFNFTP